MRLAFWAASLIAAAISPTFAQDAASLDGLDWTGGYAGAQAGLASGSITYGYYTAPPNIIPFGVNGFVGGLQGGYDWQAGDLVLGVNGEIYGASINGSITGDQFPCSFETCTFNADWIGTVGVRAGVVIDRFMPFVTAGLAAGGIRGTVGAGPCFPAISCEFAKTGIGTVLGLGVELAMDEHLSFTGKLQRVTLGSAEFPTGAVRTDSITVNAMTFGANWRF